MKDNMILFSSPMVQAINADRKTQTRRAVKPQPEWTEPATAWIFREDGHSGQGWYAYNEDYPEEGALFYRFPYGQPGDRLLVRETFFAYGRWETRFSAKKGRDEWHFIDMAEECGFSYLYAADNPDRTLAKGRGTLLPGWHRRPAIFMPRRAIRIFLEVVSVRVERLQDISEADAIAEGVQSVGGGRYWLGADGLTPRGSAVTAYRDLWIHINGAESWDENPWVWVVEFKKIEEQSHG